MSIERVYEASGHKAKRHSLEEIESSFHSAPLSLFRLAGRGTALTNLTLFLTLFKPSDLLLQHRDEAVVALFPQHSRKLRSRERELAHSRDPDIDYSPT